MKKIDGLQRMLDFLGVLNAKGIQFRIEQQSPDSLMVTFARVGKRIEVDFAVEGMQFSIFSGNESVITDAAALDRLLAD